MTSNAISDRQQQILDATLELVLKEGLIKTSISKISKQAKASPGIVYHYFDSKDDIMHTLFVSIFSEMMAHLLDGMDTKQDVLTRYTSLWLRQYHYNYHNPAKTVYIEQYKNSSYYTAEIEQQTYHMMAELMAIGERDIEAGLVADLPRNVIYTMIFGVAVSLAKSHIQTGVQMDDAMLLEIAERVCKGVLA